MATSGKVNGTLVMVAVGGENIACTTGAIFNGTNEEVDATCKDNNGAYDTLAGQQKWTIEVNGIAKYDASYGLRELEAAWKNKTTVEVTYGTGVTGDPYKTGEALITNYNQEGPLNAPETWSVTFTGKGEITLGDFT